MTPELQLQAMTAPQYAMPAWVNTYVLYAMVAATAGVLVWAARLALRYRSPMPIFIVIASALTCFTNEALVCLIGHATHSQIGQDALYTAYGRMIPTYLLFAYVLYFGTWFLYLYPRMVEGRVTGAVLWKLYLSCVAFAYFMEIPGISMGLWTYYEPQPFYIWKATLPPAWAFFNAFAVMFGAVALDKLLPVLTGAKQPLILVCLPIAVPMGSFSAAMPFQWAMNAGLGQWAIDLGGMAAIAASLFGMWLLIQLGYRDAEHASLATARPREAANAAP